MHYYFCPRCNFRMTATKPLCPTCGYKIPRQPKKIVEPENNQSESIPSFWSKLLRHNFASAPSEKTKSA